MKLEERGESNGDGCEQIEVVYFRALTDLWRIELTVRIRPPRADCDESTPVRDTFEDTHIAQIRKDTERS